MTTTATTDSYRQRFVFPDNIAIGSSDLPVSPGSSSLIDMQDAPLDMLNNPMSRNTSPLLYYSGANSSITNNHNNNKNNNTNNNTNNNSNQTPASRPSSGIFPDDIELPQPAYHTSLFDPAVDLINVNTESRRQSLKSNPFIQPQQLHQQQDTFPSSLTSEFSRSQPPPLQSTPGHIKKAQNPFKKHTTSLPACPSLESLIQLDTQHSAASKEYGIKARRLEQTLIYNNVVNRLQYSLSTLTVNLADRFKSDPAAFTPAYTQAVDFFHTILQEDMTFADHRFASFLKPSNQKLLNIFLLLIKSSPSFICASLSRMNLAEVNAFCSSPSDPYDNFASCHRTNALDIIFHSFFPPNAPVLQKFQYFSFIVAFLLDNYLPTERYTRLCLEIIDRFVSPARFTMFQSFEPALLGFLRDGNFILKSSHRFSVFQDPQPSAFQTYSRPFNSTPPSSYQQSESHLAASMNLMNNNYFNSSPSLSLQMATAVPYIDTDTTSISSVHSHSEDIDFDSKRTTFINDAVLQFLEHLNSCRMVLFDDLVHFVRLVVHKISPGNKLTILRFIFFEFFFKRMLQTLFASPETYALVKDFYVSTDQRNKILIPIYQTCLSYTEATVFKDQVAVNVPHDIALQIDWIYEYFLTTLDSADDVADDSVAHQNIIDGDVLDHLGELHEIKESIYSGQLLVLSPADVYTLYASLFPFYSVQPRKNSITSTTSSNPNTISNQTTGSIFSYGYHSHKRSTSTGYTSTGASTPTRPDMASFQKPYQKLDDLNMLLSDYEQKESPLFGSKRDGPCQWNLDDVYLDIEPVFDELVKKFPYLQFLSQPVHVASLRAHKTQHLRLPTPASEKWQVFYIGEPAAVYAVDEDTLVDKMCLLEKNHHGDNPFAADFVKSPLPASAQPYANVVVSALEKLISQSSISGSTWHQRQQHMHYHQSENYPFASYMPESRPLFMDAFMAPLPLRRAVGSESPSYIIDLLASSAEQSISTNNFLDGGKYSNAIEALLRILPSENSTSYEHICAEINSYLMRTIKRDKERRIDTLMLKLRKCDEYINPYATAIQFASHACEATLQMLGDLRTKVFYATEVRSNAMWVRARDIIAALNRGSSFCNNDKDGFDDTARSPVFGPSTHSSHHSYRSYTLKRNSSTSSLSSLGAYTFKRLTGGTTKRDYSHKRASFAHYVGASTTGSGPGDAMFALEEYSGANKLSDKEAQATLNWLDGQKIERFCDGEELIHRFFCEIDDLVKRFTTADSSSGGNRRSQSIIASSSLYKHDLGKLIFEVEGIDRSSSTSVTGVYPSKSSFYKFRSNSCTKLEAEPTSSRRKSIDGSITGGITTSITGGGSNNSGGGASDNAASNPFQGRPKSTLFPAAELTLSRSYSLRGHKSLKSSPNLIEMFGSLDIGASPAASSSPSFKKLNDFYPKSYHERSLSTSDSNRVDGSNGFHSNNSSLHNAGVSIGTTEEFGIGRVTTPLADDIGRLKNEERRKELEQMIIELQMKLTGLAFSDIGIEGWLKGKLSANGVLNKC
jgi:hypothetical protein